MKIDIEKIIAKSRLRIRLNPGMKAPFIREMNITDWVLTKQLFTIIKN